MSGCLTSNDCPDYTACQSRKCINPCAASNVCASNANCRVTRHQAVCTCPDGYIGSPEISCSLREWICFIVLICFLVYIIYIVLSDKVALQGITSYIYTHSRWYCITRYWLNTKLMSEIFYVSIRKMACSNLVYCDFFHQDSYSNVVLSRIYMKNEPWFEL